MSDYLRELREDLVWNRGWEWGFAIGIILGMILSFFACVVGLLMAK